MRGKEFRTFLIDVLGPHTSQTSAAHILGVDPRTIRRKIRDDDLINPGWVVDLQKVTGRTPNDAIARFVTGKALGGDTARHNDLYLLHTQHPRFLCKVTKENCAGATNRKDQVIARHFACGDWVMFDFMWFDAPTEQVTEVLEYACQVLDSAPARKC